MKRTPEENFDYFVRDPRQWFLKGQTLYRASMRLFDVYQKAFEGLRAATPGTKLKNGPEIIADQQMFEPAAMLAGFSLEVMIKAAIIAKHPDLIRPGMRSSDWTEGTSGGGHDLIALAEKAVIESVDDSLFETLREFSIWKGRYPSNLSGEPMYGMGTKLENLGGTHWLGLIKRFERAYGTIYKQVNEAIRDSESRSE